MAELSASEGQLAARESQILKNLLRLRSIRVDAVMTPRTVVFALPETTTVEEYFLGHDHVRFSRIPIYTGGLDQVHGFVLRSDLLLAQARGNSGKALGHYRRDMLVLPETLSLTRAFNLITEADAHIALIVDEYGDMQGILTLEDIIETLLGLEIVDEGDEAADMRELARKRWHKRARKLGLEVEP